MNVTMTIKLMMGKVGKRLIAVSSLPKIDALHQCQYCVNLLRQHQDVVSWYLGPVGGVVKGAEQGACAASPSDIDVDGALERARERQIAAEVERALRPARDSARGGATRRGGF